MTLHKYIHSDIECYSAVLNFVSDTTANIIVNGYVYSLDTRDTDVTHVLFFEVNDFSYVYLKI